ncbi:MAG: hypothetical protein ACK5V3_09860 [Bdellovibrionales bacterium]
MKIIIILLCSLSLKAWSMEPRAEQPYTFDYANIFASEASMLASAQFEANYINTYVLAPYKIEIQVDSVKKHDMSVHTIKGRLKGKDCRVDLALYKKIPYPVLRRALWKEMLEGVGIIWPTQKDSYDTKRANYLLVPACY